MYVLGIVGGTRVVYQDCAASLVRDGLVVAAVEEERLIRQKHAAGRMPEQAIRSVLASEGIEMRDVACIVTHGSSWQPDFRETVRAFISARFGCCPEVELVHHHDAHCASAYYASGFDEAMVVSLDFSGDGTATQLAVGRHGEMEVVERIERPNSLGVFYSALTDYCGFSKYDGEYKLMGLSAYGDPDRHDLSWFLDFGDGRYRVDPEYLLAFRPGAPSPTQQVPLYSQALVRKLGAPARAPEAPMTPLYRDLAASAQRLLEDAVVDLVRHFQSRTGLRKLCIAGGVGLNVLMNQRLMNLDVIDALYVQPASHDGGISLGAAYLGAARRGQRIAPMRDAYLGPEYANDEIEAALRLTRTSYRHVENPSEYAAEQVARDRVVGWFQGRMEFGPRALGNRSILANPTNPEMQDIVNERIKFREQFRPFCPSVLEAEAATHFSGKAPCSPHMTVTYDVRPEAREALPAVTHADATARIQTVRAEQNPRFHALLSELRARIGCGVVLNTSLNVRGMPIDSSPYHALATFYGSGMDCLVMGNFALEK